MNNDYTCPKCKNHFPKSNQIMHDLKCTVENPMPLDQSRQSQLNPQENNQVDNINFDNEIYKTNCKSQNKNMKNKPQLSMRITPRKRNHKNNILSYINRVQM